MLGIGLLFLGMSVMGEAMSPLRSYEPFLGWMVRLENPAIGIVAGTLFTALIQSSSATTGIVIVMASQGFISLPAGIALVFGANIGTCITAMLASIGKPREAQRAAVVHQARRLVAEEPNRLPAYTVEMDILQNLKRIYYFAKRMARMVVPPEVIRRAL